MSRLSSGPLPYRSFRRLPFARRTITAVVGIGLILGVVRALEIRQYRTDLSEAEREFTAGRLSSARDRLSRLAERWPDDPEVQFRLGVCEHARGRRRAALAAWARVPARSVFAAQAAALRGFELTNSGQYASAETILEAALRNSDRAPYDLTRALTRLYLFEGRVDDARGMIVRSWRQAPDPAAALKQIWALDTTPLPMDGWQRALENADPADDRVWLGWAHFLLFSARYDEARKRLTACLERRPHDPVAWRAHLRLARACDDFEGAWDAASHLPHDALTATETLDLRAWLAAHRADGAAERRALLDVVAQTPGNARTWERLAVLAAQAGDAEQAERCRARKADLDRATDQYRKIILYEGNLTARAGELAHLASQLGRTFDAQAWSRLRDRPASERGAIGGNDPPEPIARAQARNSRTLADLLGDLRPRATAHESRAAGVSEPRFTDDAVCSGLRFAFDNGATPNHEIPETMAGGVAVFDYDGDGWLDVYAVQGGPFHLDAPRPDTDHLFRNNRDGTFQDVTAEAGITALSRSYTVGVAVGDYDNDGHPDLFLSRLRSYALFRNRGDGTFEEATETAGLSGRRDNPSSAAFADLDNDGDLDLYVCHYMIYDPAHPRLCPDKKGGYMYCDPYKLDPAPDHVFRNDRGRFVDVTTESGFTDLDGRGLGVVAADLDGDNRVDLYVANDGTANYLFHNLGGFRFEEIAHAAGAAAGADGGYHAGMGVACGDVDGDGLPDLVVTNFYGEASTLYRNLGGGRFTDRTTESGLGAATRYLLGFGTSFLDYDNDGQLDLLTVYGHVNDHRPYTPFEMPVQLLRGKGGGALSDVSVHAGKPWNLLRLGRGLATGDLDNDGRIDAVILAQNRPLAYFHNKTRGGHFVTLAFEGTVSNREGIGAHVEITTGERRMVAQRVGGGSYQSAGDSRLHFGLGSATRIDTLAVRWPSGRAQRFHDLSADRGYRICEDADRALPLAGFAGSARTSTGP